MKELIDIEDEMLSHEQVVSDLQQRVAQGDLIVSPRSAINWKTM
jgi:hypothetical protein